MAAEQFRRVLSDVEKVDRLVDVLGHADMTGLLGKQHALEKLEIDKIKASCNDSRDVLRQVIGLLIEKNDLSRYIGFSQVVQFKNRFIHQQLFPFITPCDHSELTVKSSRMKVSQTSIASVSPHILWLCEDSSIFDIAKDVVCVPDSAPIKSTPGGTFQYFEIPAVDTSVLVWLFYPVNKHQSLLLQYYNKSQYFIYTGTCVPNNIPHVLNTDICVARKESSCCNRLIEEIRHMKFIWDNDSEVESWKNCEVRFCMVNSDVISNGATKFCEAGETHRKSHITVLAVNRDQSECNDSSVLHTVEFTNKIIKYLCKKTMLLQCYSRKN